MSLSQVIIFLSPTICTFPSVLTSKTLGTDSCMVTVSPPTNDSISIITSKEFGFVVGSILLWAVLIILNSTNDFTSNVVLKFVSIPFDLALISTV